MSDMEHYIVGEGADTLTAACGTVVPTFPIPPAGSRQCGTCITLVETADRVY